MGRRGGTAKLCRSKINVPAQNSRVGTTFDKTLVMVTLQKKKKKNAIHKQKTQGTIANNDGKQKHG